MARKKHLINVHTSTGTTAPTGASLYLGEIAVQHTQDDPALWIKVGSAETSTEYEKFIGLTEITNIFNMSHILGSGYTYSGLSYVNSATTIADAYSALTKELIDDELVVAAALNDLNNRIPEPVDLEPLSASVVNNVQSINTLSAIVETDELVTAAALNDLNDRIIELSASTGDNAEMIEYIQENEEVVAAALNNLNHRVGTVETHMTGDYIPITGYILACGTTEEELTLRETDTVNEALGKLQKQSLDNEEAIAAGLNDLNQRVSENAAAIARNTGVTALSGAVRSLSAATYNIIGEIGYGVHRLSSATQSLSSETQSLSASVMSISAKTSGILTVNVNGEEQGKYSPSANTTLDLEIIQEVTGADVLLTGYELASGTTEEELAILASDTVNEAFGKIQKQNYDNEAVVAGALNDLDERVVALENGGGGGGDAAVTGVSITGTGNAITDAAFTNKQLTLTKGNVQATISDLATIRSNAASGMSAYNNVNALSAATTGINNTLTTVSGAAHNKITTLSGATVSISGYAHSKITALSAATTGINSTLTTVSGAAHSKITALSGGTVSALAGKSNTGHTHSISEVTNLQTTLNGKSNTGHTHAISEITNLQTTLNGKSDTGHTHAIRDITNLQTTLDGKSGTGHTHSNYATTGNVSTLSSATQSIQSSAQTAYNSRITGGTITSGSTNSITTTSNRVAITAATLPSYSTANNDQVLMIKNGIPQWVTPSTITYSSSQPTGGNDGDIWIQTS